MKKNIIAALAVAAFGVSAFAQDAQPASDKDFVIGAKFDFESRYISDGKRHVNENMQTTISLKYFAPSSSDIGFTPYADFFWMSPTDNERNGAKLSDEGSFKIGSEVAIGESFDIDFGYKFTGWNDKESAEGMNRAELNRSNEIYFGVAKTLSLIDGNEDADVRGTAYVHYNWNLEQLAYELGLEKTFAFDDFGLRIAAVYGYLDANKATGDQRSADVPKKHNDYGYVAVSADLSYQINSGTDVGIGVRYAYNNDGDDEPVVNGDNNSSNIWWGAWLNFRY